MKTLSLILAVGAGVAFTTAKIVSHWWTFQRGFEQGKGEGFQLGYAEGHKDADRFWAGIDEQTMEKLRSDQLE